VDVLTTFCLITPRSGRSASDDAWQTIELAHINIWKSAIAFLGERKLTHGDTTYAVTVDWIPILRRHQRHYSAMKYLDRSKKEQLEHRLERARFPRRPTRTPIAVSTTGRGPLQTSNVIESLLHDIFLIMNIAAPGCCDFYKASLSGAPYEPDISLSNVHFENALYIYLHHGWPIIQTLELHKVISWFEKVRQGITQMPRNPAERVLFALLHMAKIDVSPMMVIWQFYALESFLQTRVGENFSSIVRRLCLLLGANAQQSKLLGNKLRTLYDIRSAIVHGGFEVTHPMHNDILDKRINESFSRLINATDFGNAILLASIQKTIENDWKFPRFDEVVRGDVDQQA
jgi:hypothetical protein